MRVLVTGAAGFIGRHLVSALRARGDHVTGVDRRGAPGPGHHVLDLADDSRERDLAALAGDVDVVFHLAGRPGVRGGGPEVEAARWRDNVEATARLLDVVPMRTPVVATSSSSVYGGAVRTATGLRPSREDDRLRPKGGYARSKLAVERLCELRRHRGGTVAVIRPFTVAGEGQRPDMAFSQWLAAVRAGRPIRIFGSPDNVRDVTDVRHVVEGLVRAGDRRVDGAVNLGTGTGHRLIEMASAVLEAAATPGEIVVEPASSEEARATLADTERCSAILGFVPTTDLFELVARQVAAAMDHEAWDRPAAPAELVRR